MKASIYIKNYLVSDIILVAILLGVFYLVTGMFEENKLEDDNTVELVPINAVDEELS